MAAKVVTLVSGLIVPQKAVPLLHAVTETGLFSMVAPLGGHGPQEIPVPAAAPLPPEGAQEAFLRPLPLFREIGVRRLVPVPRPLRRPRPRPALPVFVPSPRPCYCPFDFFWDDRLEGIDDKQTEKLFETVRHADRGPRLRSLFDDV